jgi:hypothetical protein
VTARRLALAALLVALASSARAQLLVEGFDDVAALPAGWLVVNNAVPQTGWFQGNPGPFAAQAGAAGAYAAANFVTAGNTGTADDWLISPVLPLTGGERISFYTRTGDPGFSDLLRVRVGVGSSSALGNFTTILLSVGSGTAYPVAWTAYEATVPSIAGLTSGRIAFQYNAASAVADYVGIDSLSVLPPADSDGDTVKDVSDNCPTLANLNQADGDGDGVGDVCDNCLAVANPRVAQPVFGGNPWMTLTGDQRDDDHDGYGNKCDAKFPGVAGSSVSGNDLNQFRASNGKPRSDDTCGTSGTRPCAIFDLDELANTISGNDLTRFRALNGLPPGPKCAACPLPCAQGSAGSCN